MPHIWLAMVREDLPLTQAVLTLRLTAGSTDIAESLIQIDGLDPIASPDIQGLAPGSTKTIQFDLLDYYTSDRILAILDGGVFGEIPFTFSDGAILSYARLDMIPVPEPSSGVLLIGLSTLVMLTRRGRSCKCVI